jgi:glycosyltransferase involved in cell wall biosynthesis
MRPLRIGVNALYLIPGGVGGTEIYLQNLLRALAEIDTTNQYLLFTNRETGSGLRPAGANFAVLKQKVQASFRPARILWEQVALPLAIAAQHLDVLLNPGFTAPLLCGCPQVTVFHDLQHMRHPEHFRWFDLPFWRFLLFWSAQLSQILIADSEPTCADLLRFYRFPERKVRVIPLGVDPKFFKLANARRPEPFLLSVSTLHPHKNFDRLLRAFADFRRVHPEFRLIIAGLRGFETSNLERLQHQLGLADAVAFTGWIPRSDLYELFTRAYAFVYPSTFEGFGLPVIEALAAGVPTACSDIEPLAGITDNAALRFAPSEEASLLDAMIRIVCDTRLRERLTQAGPQRAAAYSWSRTAQMTLEALTDAARNA